MTTQKESEFLGLQYDDAIKDNTTKFYRAKKITISILQIRINTQHSYV